MTAPIIKVRTATATVCHRFDDRHWGAKTVATFVKGEINKREKNIYTVMLETVYVLYNLF